MPDQTPPATPTPPSPQPEEPADSHPTPGEFNAAQLETVRKSEGIATAAQESDCTPALIAEGMEATTPADLLAKGKEWRDLSRKAYAATTAKEQHTGEGDDTETLLRREVEHYRNKARLVINKNPKWTGPQKAAFKARYFINTDIYTSRAYTEECASALFANGLADKLPTITAERTVASAKLLATYIGTETSQTGSQSDASTLRKQRDAAFEEVVRLRHEIQLAADTAWPWHNDLNLGRRREFLLPAGRAFIA